MHWNRKGLWKCESSLCPTSQNFSGKLVSTNISKERPELSVQNRVINGIKLMLQPGMNSRSATPLHASCLKYSSHFCSKSEELYIKRQLRIWVFLMYNSGFLLLWKKQRRCQSLEKFELLSQTLTSRTSWIEVWKLDKSCVRIYCKIWCSSTMSNCSDRNLASRTRWPPPKTQFIVLKWKRPNQWDQKFQF